MKMISRKRFRKRIALFLLLVLFVPFVPLAFVSADPLPVQVPDFPYGENIYHSTNTGSFALWQVHGSNYVSYVQTYSNVFGDGSAFPVVLRSGLDWTGYYYYINYEKIIDTWDIYGNHIDGFPSTQNIRIPRPNETTTDSDVYATLVYCTTDIYYGNGYGDDDIYAYQNFIVPSYADPTPTPEPVTPLPDDMPDVENLSLMCKAVCNYGSHFFDGYINPRDYVFVYTDFMGDAKVAPKAYLWNAIEGNAFGHIYGIGAEGNYFGQMYFYKFNNDTQELTFLGSLGSSYGYNDGGRVYSAGLSFVEYGFNGRTVLNTCNFDFTNLGTTRNFAQKPYFFVYWTNSDITSGDNPLPSTPTPTPIPTGIPQPSISPAPTDPPETGTDDNYTGLFGWLKRIRDAILNIPKKIVKGLVDALKYIFLPDPEKVKAIFYTIKGKFGIQQPKEFTFEVKDLVRPKNVIWKFHPISLNGEETETTDITLINFKMVDAWLDSSPGMVITRILQAMFGITMFAYGIYIFTKHIASINYTDARTLMHLDDSNSSGSKGGWWIKDD